MSNSTFTTLGHPEDRARCDAVPPQWHTRSPGAGWWLTASATGIRDLRNLRTAQGDRRPISNVAVIAAGSLLVVIIAAAQCLAASVLVAAAVGLLVPTAVLAIAVSSIPRACELWAEYHGMTVRLLWLDDREQLQPDLPSSDPRQGAARLIELGAARRMKSEVSSGESAIDCSRSKVLAVSRSRPSGRSRVRILDRALEIDHRRDVFLVEVHDDERPDVARMDAAGEWHHPDQSAARRSLSSSRCPELGPHDGWRADDAPDDRLVEDRPRARAARPARRTLPGGAGGSPGALPGQSSETGLGDRAEKGLACVLHRLEQAGHDHALEVADMRGARLEADVVVEARRHLISKGLPPRRLCVPPERIR